MNRFVALIGADSSSIRVVEAALRRRRYNLIAIGPTSGLTELLVTCKPRLVLIDHDADGANAVALVERLRSEPALTLAAVLLYASLPERPLAELAERVGADGGLPKSSDKRVLERLLDPWLLA